MNLNISISWLVIMIAAAVPFPGQQYPFGMQATPWFTAPKVSHELNLSDDELTRLSKAYQTIRSQYEKAVADIGKNAPDDQRHEQLRGVELALQWELLGAANVILTIPQQRKCFEQMYLRYRGVRALGDPWVADRLNVSPKQRQSMLRLAENWSVQMSSLGSLYATNPELAERQYKQIQDEYARRIQTLLTPTQQETWQRLTGPAHPFPLDVYFPGDAKPAGNNK